MNRKGFSPLIVVGIIAALLVVGAVGYFTWKSSVGWKTYTNPQFSFSLQYPSEWSLQNDFDQKYADSHPGQILKLFSLEAKVGNRNCGGPGGPLAYDCVSGAAITFSIVSPINGVITSEVLAPQCPDGTLSNKCPVVPVYSTSSVEDLLKDYAANLSGSFMMKNIDSIDVNGFKGFGGTSEGSSAGPLGNAKVYKMLSNGSILLVDWQSENDVSYKDYLIPILATMTSSVPSDQGGQTGSPTNLATSTLSNACGDFGALQAYITKTIATPDATATMQMNPNVITSFEWKRATGEPRITYPIIQGYSATYGPGVESNNAIRTTIMNDANAIGQTITAEANSLGLVADNLNTLPFQSFPNQDAYHAVYGFRSGSDLYSLVVRSDNGTQAPADGTVMITCGRAVAGYDSLYTALQLKAHSVIENPYDHDVVSVQAVSDDNTVYALSGYPQTDDLGNYYYFNGSIPKLVSWGSSPAKCGVLEAQKVGLGMRCGDLNYGSGVVTYNGSQTMQNLDNTSFVIVDGLSSVSPPDNGSLAYLWIAMGSNLNNNTQCLIDFGDGSSTIIFKNQMCSGNSTSSIFHYYANPGTYTAKIIGTWENGGQQMTEVLATTTVTTSN